MKEKQVHKSKFGWGYVLFGILLIVVGACFIVIKDTFDKLSLTVGLFCSIYGGVSFFVESFCKDKDIITIFECILYIAFLAGGIAVMVYKKSAIGIVIDISCLCLIVDGAFKLQDSVKAKGKKVALWWFIFFISLGVISSAFFILKWTYDSERILALVFGSVLIVDGISNFFTAFLLRDLNTNEVAEIEKELRESQTDKEMENLKEKMDKLKKEMEDMQKAKDEKTAPTAEPTRETITQEQAEEPVCEKPVEGVATATAEEETIKTPETARDEKEEEQETQEPLEEQTEENAMTAEEEKEVDEFFGGDPTVVALDETPSEGENENEKNETNE